MFTSRLRIHVAYLFALGFLALGYVHRADAQVLYGSVSGSITDQSGAAVAKAHVIVTNRATSVTREADSDETGRYRITDVPPGDYDLKITASGFRLLTQDRKSTRLNSSHSQISYAVFCLKKK